MEENEFDIVVREVVRRTRRKAGVDNNGDVGVDTIVTAEDDLLDRFEAFVGLHLGSVLSAALLMILMNVINSKLHEVYKITTPIIVSK